VHVPSASIAIAACPDFVVKGKVAWGQLSEVASAGRTHRVFAKEMPSCCFVAFSLLYEYKSAALQKCQLHCFSKSALFFINKFNAIYDNEDFMLNALTQSRNFIESVDFTINLDAYEPCPLQSAEYIAVLFLWLQTVSGFTGVYINNLAS
jgi:hypothetical protein